MDLVKDACCSDFVEGIRAALLTVLFCGVPLGTIGIWLARRGVRPSPALQGLARFAIVLLTLNIGLVVPLTAVLTIQLLVEDGSSWYLLAFAAISWFADCFGIAAWLTIWRETQNTPPLACTMNAYHRLDAGGPMSSSDPPEFVETVEPEADRVRTKSW